mmetsp:Transcript_5248/g.7391  ORF Transcript_5248/g.7391 Transcript_5248/m.7391 type:complete len:292 (+) Transcript_5248:71-946(+)
MRKIFALLLFLIENQTNALILQERLTRGERKKNIIRWRRRDIAVKNVYATETTISEERPPYALSGLPRPKLRGAVMGYLHRTKLWYFLAFGYVIAACSLLSVTDNTIFAPLLRIFAASASSASVLISDGYHNPDLRGGSVEASEELFWLRWDYVSISLILSTNLWLWSANIGFTTLLAFGAALSLLSTFAVSYASLKIVPRRKGHIFVKLTLAFQFVALLGFLVSKTITTPLWLCSAIYFCYLPGFLLYATKRPRNKIWGYHEYFHSSVLLGHLVSMSFDLGLLSYRAKIL